MKLFALLLSVTVLAQAEVVPAPQPMPTSISAEAPGCRNEKVTFLILDAEAAKKLSACWRDARSEVQLTDYELFESGCIDFPDFIRKEHPNAAPYNPNQDRCLDIKAKHQKWIDIAWACELPVRRARDAARAALQECMKRYGIESIDDILM